MHSQQLHNWTPILIGEGGTVLDLCSVALDSGDVGILALTPTGIFHSVDDARSWRGLSEATQPPLPLSMAVGQDSAEESPIILMGSAVGLFRFQGDPERWVEILPGEAVTTIGLSTDAPYHAPIFAATENSGLLVSSDLGSSWTDSSVGLDTDPVVTVCVSPRYPADQTVFLATTTGLYRSRNGGRAWRRLDFEPGPGTVQCLGVVSDNQSGFNLYVGLSNGFFVSVDKGTKWTEVNGFAGLSVFDISVATTGGGWNVITVLSDRGCHSTDDSDGKWFLSSTGDFEALSSLSIPNSSELVLIVGTANSGIYRGSRVGGSWVACNTGLRAIHRTQIQVVESSTGDSDHLVVNEIYNGLLKSSDMGKQWNMIDGTAQAGMDPPVLQASCEPDTLLSISGCEPRKYRISEGTCEHIAPLPHSLTPVGVTSLGQARAGGLIAVTSDGRVWHYDSHGRWTDGGQSFGSEPVVAAEFVASSQQSPGVWAIVYIEKQSTSTPIPSLWRSVDSGRTWRPWLESSSPGALAVTGTQEKGHEVVFVGTHNLIYRFTLALDQAPFTLSPEDVTPNILDDDLLITSVVLSPQYRDDRTLFLGTNLGVWISLDAGSTYSHWMPDGPRQITGLALGTAPELDQYVIALDRHGTVWARQR